MNSLMMKYIMISLIETYKHSYQRLRIQRIQIFIQHKKKIVSINLACKNLDIVS